MEWGSLEGKWGRVEISRTKGLLLQRWASVTFSGWFTLSCRQWASKPRGYGHPVVLFFPKGYDRPNSPPLSQVLCLTLVLFHLNPVSLGDSVDNHGCMSLIPTVNMVISDFLMQVCGVLYFQFRSVRWLWSSSLRCHPPTPPSTTHRSCRSFGWQHHF